MGMALKGDDLLVDEELVVTKSANAVIRPSEYGLKRFPFDKYMPLVGMKGREAIGGKLHLTTFRLLFKAHAVNRAKGSFSIFLPTVTGVRNASRLATRKVRIETPSQEFEFVLWGIPGFLAAVNERREQLDAAQVENLVAAIQMHPEVVSQDLEVSRSVDLLIRGTATTLKILKATQGQGVVSTLINLSDLLDQ